MQFDVGVGCAKTIGMILAISFSLPIAGCVAGSRPGYHYRTSNIIQHRAEYDGKTMTLVGVLWPSYEGDALCAGGNDVSIEYAGEMRKARDRLLQYVTLDGPIVVKVTGRFRIRKNESTQAAGDDSNHDDLEEVIPLPAELIVSKISTSEAPEFIQKDDPGYSCYYFRPFWIRSPKDGAKITWMISEWGPEHFVHLGVSESDMSYWRYEYASGRGIEPATTDDTEELDKLFTMRRSLDK
ncbi:MAG: hypothetical protein ABUL58_00745 [Steroidobacter sp.]